MSVLTGGVADKLGNRFEANAFVRLAVEVLSGKSDWVVSEPIGEDVVDLMHSRDGRSSIVQAKLRGANGIWTLSNLRNKVLARAFALFRKGQHHGFQFVTADPAPEYDYLHRVAEQVAVHDEFVKRATATQAGAKAWPGLLDVLGLDASSADDRRDAIGFLRWFRVDVHSEDTAADDAMTLLSLLIEGSASAAADVLRGLATSRMNERLTSDILWEELAKAELKRLHVAPVTATEKLASLCGRFVSREENGLPNGKMLDGERTEVVVEEVLAGGELVALLGEKGAGKSVVVGELVRKLRGAGHAVLPLRLSEIETPDTPDTPAAIGRAIGFTGSPTQVLCAVRRASADPERPAYLVLDQLDALRWSATHAAAAADAVREMVVAASQPAGAIRVVLVCRTADWDRDTQLRRTAGDSDVTTVRLAPLSVEVVYEAASRLGWELTGRQVEVLQNPAAFAAWREVASTADVSFNTDWELQEAVWRQRRGAVEAEIGPGAVAEREAVLEKLSGAMIETGRNVADISLLGTNETLKKSMLSNGLYQVEGRNVRFGHQTEMEYLVAEQALREIESGGTSVIDWLGDPCEQSIVRREPLRLVLSLLASRDGGLDRHVRSVIEDESLRFHVRQLAVEVLAELPANDDWLRLVEELIDGEWAGDVLRAVVRSRDEAFLQLAESGLLDELAGRQATRWLVEMCLWQALDRDPEGPAGDLVARWAAGSDATRHIAESLATRRPPASQTEALFALRLARAEASGDAGLTNWRELSRDAPDRAIRLFAASLRGSENEDRLELQMDRNDKGLGPDGLCRAAFRHPDLTWSLIREPYRQHAFRTVFGSGTEAEGIVGTAARLLFHAGRRRAAISPNDYLAEVADLLADAGDAERGTLLRTLRGLPESHADGGVDLLLSDARNFSCGDPTDESRITPALDVVASLARRCGDVAFGRLQSFAESFVPAERIDDYRFFLNEGRSRCDSGQWLLEPRLTLLESLPVGRREARVQSQIESIRRQLDGGRSTQQPAATRLRNAERPQGAEVGFVSSSIPDEAAFAFSDSEWTEIVTIPAEELAARAGGGDFLKVSTVGEFAKQLERVAVTNPARFVRLALTWARDDVDAAYWSAPLAAAAVTQVEPHPQRQTPGAVASVNDVVQLLQRIPFDETGTPYYWLSVIRKRRDLPAESFIDEAIKRASQSDSPRPGALIIGDSYAEASEHELHTSGLNSTRGQAADVLAARLRDHPNLVARHQPTIDRLVRDPHAGVRIMAMPLVQQRLAADTDEGVSLFEAAIAPDIRVAVSRRAARVLGFCSTKRPNLFAATVDRMLASDLDEVREAGGRWATAEFIADESMSARFGRCIEADEATAGGVAKQLAENLEHLSDNAYEWLRYLWDSETESVRQKASNFGLKCERRYAQMLREYPRSAAFKDDPGDHAQRLKSAAEESDALSHADAIFGSCEVWEEARERGGGVLPEQFSWTHHWVVDTVLKLHDELLGRGDSERLRRCLDAIDQLLRAGVGSASTYLRQFDGDS